MYYPSYNQNQTDFMNTHEVKKTRPMGASILRHEDPPLLKGEASYVADIHLPGSLAIAFVRSSIAHGTLNDVDTSPATDIAGVEGVYTAADLESSLGTLPKIPPRVSFDQTVIPYLQPLLATDRVRYVGEPIAIVVASNRYVAEDAAEMVFADIEPVAASLDDTPGEPIYPEGNLITTLRAEFGDVDRAIGESEIVVEADLNVGRHTGVPMETRGIAVECDLGTGHFTIHGATKVPHWNRATICDLLDIPPARLTMKETAVGGGFGVRGELYPEDVLAVWVAQQLGRSVTWIEDRREHLLASNHSRQQRHRAVIAGDETGRITAIATEFSMDMGAYVRTHSIRVADLTLSMLPGPYHIENYRGSARCVITNKTPTGTYRSPGRFESSFVRERLIDLFAARVGVDPIQVRRKNVIKSHQIPYTRPLSSTGESIVFGEGDFPRMLDLAASSLDISDLNRRRNSGETVGAGVAMFLEKSGLGPWESGSIDVDPDGVVSVRSGCSSVGQGIRTALAQIVADRLEVNVDQVRVELLDTDRTEHGIGSYASRSTVTAGSALVGASEEIIETVKKIAAVDFEVDPLDLEYRDGVVEVRGSPEFRMTIFEAASKLTPTAASRYGLETPGLKAEAVFDIERVVYPCGAQGAVVAVDEETGAVTVEELVLCYDIGKAVNPMLVRGQMEGGALQAIGGTLLEEFAYDEQGNPLVTSFMDYMLPTIAETPRLRAIPSETTTTETNPLGIKGAGEGGVSGVAAAIASAVDDALGRAGAVTTVPIKPEHLA